MTDSINVSLGFSISLAGQRVRTGFDLYILFPSKFSWKKSIFRSIFEDLWAPLVSRVPWNVFCCSVCKNIANTADFLREANCPPPPHWALT